MVPPTSHGYAYIGDIELPIQRLLSVSELHFVEAS